MSAPAAVIEGMKAVAAWEYQTAHTVMLPYREENRAVFEEEFIAKLYYRLKEEGSLGKIFPGQGLFHLNKFIAHMGQSSGLVICCQKTPTKPEPIGFGWITEAQGCDGARRAAFGFGFFKKAWGLQVNVDLSWFMLAYWFQCLKIDVLYGSTLKTNRLALRYSRHFGFTHLCTLPLFFTGPHGLEDAELIVLKKTDFMPRYFKFRKDRCG